MSDTESAPTVSGAPKTQKSLGKTAKMTAVWDFGGRVTSQSVLFVVGIVLARVLTPADFGITAAARFFVQLAARLTQLGLNASLVRMKHMRPEHASSVFVVNLIAGFTAFGVLCVASPALARLFHSADVARILPVTALVFLITPFGTVAAAMLNRHLRYRASTIIQWIDGVAGSIFALILALFGFGYWSLVLGALGGTVLSTSAKVYCSPWRMSIRFSRAALRDTLSFGLGFQAKNLLTFGASNLDNLVVGRVLGVTSLGFYDKAYGLMHQLTNRMAFDSSLMRIFAILMDKPERFRTALLKGVRATTLVMFPMLAFSGVAAHSLVLVIYGARWEASIGPFQVLAAAGLLRSAMRPVHSANEALGLVWYQTFQQAVYLTAIVVGVAVGARWGLTAASFGVLFGTAFESLISLHLLVHNSTVRTADLFAAVRDTGLMTLTMCLAVGFVDHGLSNTAWSSHGPAGLGLLIVTAAVTYGTLVIWTPFPSIAQVVREIVDDVAPWLLRFVRVGVFKPVALPAPASATDGAVASGSRYGDLKTGAGQVKKGDDYVAFETLP